MAPRLSIITIMWNAKEGFIATADSIGPKIPPWCEWIVVDGLSTDGSLAAMQERKDLISKSVSERDEGIADAFNKGIALAQGKFVLFLNAGDCLIPGFFEIADQLLVDRPVSCVIVGRIVMGNRVYGRNVSFQRQLLRNYLPHQAMLIKRSLFRLVGTYDKSFRLGMDYEWSLRLKGLWKDVRFVDFTLTKMEPGGRSISNFRETYWQYHKARGKHCRWIVISYLVSLCFIVKVSVGRFAKGLIQFRLQSDISS